MQNSLLLSSYRISEILRDIGYNSYNDRRFGGSTVTKPAGEQIRKITEIEELLPMLISIAELKNHLPLHLRAWLNDLGLYVQLRYAGGWARLEAGGMFRSCLDALCRDPSNIDALLGKASAWGIRKFDQERWLRSFAHLVEPTFEIALFVSGSDMTKPSGSQFDEQAVATLRHVTKHFKTTGEWLGLPSGRKCTNCGQSMSIGQWRRGTCPYCRGSLV